MNLQGVSSYSLKELQSFPNEKESFDTKGIGNKTKNTQFEKVLGSKISNKSVENEDESLTTESRESTAETTGLLEKNKKTVENQSSSKFKKEEKIKKFMDSFEGEFQVPPTRLVEVITQLPVEQLSESAESTADTVIEQLDLPPAEAPKAKKMYMQLIQDLNDENIKSDSPVLNVSVGLLGAQYVQERFDKVQLQKENLQKSIDKLNNKFWNFDPTVNKTDTSTLDTNKMQDSVSSTRLSGDSSIDKFTDTEPESFLQKASFNQFTTDNVSKNKIADDKFLNTKAVVQSDILNSDEIKYSPLKDKNASTELVDSQISLETLNAKSLPPEGAKLISNNLKSEPNSDLSASTNAQGNSFNVSGSSFNSSAFGNSSENSESAWNKKDFFYKPTAANSKKSAINKTQTEDLKTLMAAELGVKSLENSDSTKSAVQVQNPLNIDVTPKDMDKNIQGLIHQAQYLVKKGGGEVNVKMSPEGLGDIQLKVELVNGKVQMQMMAENKETKKILESNMSELKDHLLSNKISLESIKIDSVQNLSSDVATKNHNQFSQNQDQSSPNREHRQFWNQFQDQFGGRNQREALYENPRTNNYVQKRSDPLKPIEDKGAEKVTTTVSSSKNTKGINLVA